MRKKNILFVLLVFVLLAVLTACINSGPEIDKDLEIIGIEVSVLEDSKFTVGDTFNKENFLVLAVHKNGDKNEFENLNAVEFNVYDKLDDGSYIVDAEEKLTKAGVFEIKVTFNDKVTTVEIEVKAGE